MHEAVMEYVARFASQEPIAVLDIGGRNVNGTARVAFPKAFHTVLDIRPGTDVDVVADAATWEPAETWDLVLCTEVFEHTADYPEICQTAFKAVRPGGRLVVTCAAPGRAPHSAYVEAGLQPGEFYSNVRASGLRWALERAGWQEIEVEQVGLDLHATAVHP